MYFNINKLKNAIWEQKISNNKIEKNEIPSNKIKFAFKKNPNINNQVIIQISHKELKGKKRKLSLFFINIFKM